MTPYRYARPGWAHRRRQLALDALRTGLTLVAAIVVSAELWLLMLMAAATVGPTQ